MEPSVRSDAGESVALRVEDLSKSFGSHVVLNGIDLSIEIGELVAIVGGSGSGKTVLLEHLFGNMKPTGGRVLVADFDDPARSLVDLGTADEETMDRLRVHWAVVFQKNALFSGTVYENIALWLREIRRMSRDEIMPIAERSLRAVGLDPSEVMFRDRDNLSGGMAKRVAVARALAMSPMMVFYDEPTTGLDPHFAGQIHELVMETHRERVGGVARTSVIVTHDKDLLRRLEPRVVMLHGGRVYFDGSYKAFRRSDSEIIRPYFDQMPGLHGRPHVDDADG